MELTGVFNLRNCSNSYAQEMVKFSENRQYYDLDNAMTFKISSVVYSGVDWGIEPSEDAAGQEDEFSLSLLEL